MVTSSWPYPAFPDPEWLGGARSGDPALITVIRSLRSLLAETGNPVDDRPETLLAALGRCAEISERIDWAMLSLVGEARAHGQSWSRIGGAMGVTKQAVQHRFSRYVAEALDRARLRS
ncbi:MAG TPA: hypothetical protein VNG13_12535 [Mycobacteriales bacterium]|nr:hypothetical protein [Mycobacteriales bacterium]